MPVKTFPKYREAWLRNNFACGSKLNGKTMRSMRFSGLALSFSLLAACGGDSTNEPIIELPVDPVNLTVIGLGAVNERFTSEIAVVGNIGYTGTWSRRFGNWGDVVKIWDLAPASPVLLDSLLIEGAGTVGDVQISEDKTLLVVANEYNPNGAITLFNIANPRTPLSITRFTTPDIARGVHTVKLAHVNGKHYAFLCINNAGVPARLVIVDITAPGQPVQVFSAAMGNPFVHDVFVRDGLLFTALWHDGLTVWDIGGGGRGGSVTNPVALGNIKTTGGFVHNVYWYHNQQTGSKRYIFVGEEQVVTPTAGDIHVVDASDFSKMKEVAVYHRPQFGTHNFAVDEANGVLYAAYYEAGVRALDITGDLHSCRAEEKTTDGRCNLLLMHREIGNALTNDLVKIWGVALNDTHLFASDMQSGIWKIDNSPLR